MELESEEINMPGQDVRADGKINLSPKYTFLGIGTERRSIWNKLILAFYIFRSKKK
jgi:hypothetical protein